MNIQEALILHSAGNLYWKNKELAYLGCNYNFARLLKLKKPSDIAGKTDFDFIKDKALSEKIQKSDREVFKTKKGITREEVAIDVQGNPAYYLSYKVPLFNSRGSLIGLIGTSIDITPQKKAELARTQFLENMRHDIRTPLTGITGLANLIKKNSQNKKISHYADNLIVSAETLLEFMNKILETIKLKKETSVSVEQFNLRTLIQSVINLNQAKITEKSIALTLKLSKTFPEILLGDSNKIYKIILELLTNAIKFTPTKGKINISAELKKNMLQITIKDTGIGISTEKQSELFQEFGRLTSAYDGLYPGLGLGLSCVKNYIDTLKGKIQLKSKSNKGAEFVCLIPIKIVKKNISAAISKTKPEKKSKNIIHSDTKNFSRILLVEDSKITAETTKELLESIHCKVDIAQNGKTALTKIREKSYDLIFMDIGLPDMNGMKVTEEIRRYELTHDKHIPILALTAHIESENKQNCIKSGMNAVLSKPLSEDTAIDMLSAFIPNRQYQHRSVAPDSKIAPSKPSPKSIQPKIIDLEKATAFLKKSDTSYAKKLLALFMSTLPQELAEFTSAHQKGDWQQVIAIAHKLRGATIYCGAYRLHTACANLEDDLCTSKKSNKTLREKHTEAVLKQIQALTLAYQKYQKDEKLAS